MAPLSITAAPMSRYRNQIGWMASPRNQGSVRDCHAIPLEDECMGDAVAEVVRYKVVQGQLPIVDNRPRAGRRIVGTERRSPQS
jgi:hypothetical protein